MRIATTLLVGVILLTGCAGDGIELAGGYRVVEVTPAAGAPAAPPAGESTAEGGSSLAVGFPSGMTFEDLPEDFRERRKIMRDWIDDEYEDLYSGSSAGGPQDEFELGFSVRLTDRAEAEALCPFFVEITDLYLPDANVVAIQLDGWVNQPDGSFVDPGWELVDCI